jgi:phage gp36-like protein
VPVLAGTVYATRTDLTQIGLVGAALANVPTAAQDEALQAASAIADSYLQGQYVLPLAQWGYDLVRVVCCVAAWDCLTARGYSPQSQGDQNVYKRYEDALKWLDEVSKGMQTPANILDASTPPTDPDGGTVTQVDGGSVVSTQVRGWTDRGVGSFDNGPGTGGWWR